MGTSIGQLVNRLMRVQARLGTLDLMLVSDRATRDEVRSALLGMRREVNTLLEGTADLDAQKFLEIINGLYGDEDLRAQLEEAERHLMGYVHKLFGQNIMITISGTSST